MIGSINPKKGDIVRCINKYMNETSDLIIGKEYIIKEFIVDEAYEEDGIIIEELSGIWSISQFEYIGTPKKVIKQYGIVSFLEGINK